MEDASELSRLSEAECPVIWIRGPRCRCPTSWDNTPDAVVHVITIERIKRWSSCTQFLLIVWENYLKFLRKSCRHVCSQLALVDRTLMDREIHGKVCDEKEQGMR